MSRDVLFLLEPGFTDPKHPGERFVCPHGLSIEGLLASDPSRAASLDVKRIGFARPRHDVIAALDGRIKALPPTSVIGLWTFDGHEGRAEVPAGPLADQVNGQPRSAALSAALDKQYSSGGGAVSFTTLRLIYQEMLANYRAGQENSILVITAGPHTDQSLDGPGLQDFIKNSADPARPVAVNVIDFGGDPDRATWEAVARLSGGSYQNLPTSAGPDLATAVNNFLS